MREAPGDGRVLAVPVGQIIGGRRAGQDVLGLERARALRLVQADEREVAERRPLDAHTRDHTLVEWLLALPAATRPAQTEQRVAQAHD